MWQWQSLHNSWNWEEILKDCSRHSFPPNCNWSCCSFNNTVWSTANNGSTHKRKNTHNHGQQHRHHQKYNQHQEAHEAAAFAASDWCSKITCCSCGEDGHIAPKCWKKNKAKTASTAKGNSAQGTTATSGTDALVCKWCILLTPFNSPPYHWLQHHSKHSTTKTWASSYNWHRFWWYQSAGN